MGEGAFKSPKLCKSALVPRNVHAPKGDGVMMVSLFFLVVMRWSDYSAHAPIYNEWLYHRPKDTGPSDRGLKRLNYNKEEIIPLDKLSQEHVTVEGSLRAQILKQCLKKLCISVYIYMYDYMDVCVYVCNYKCIYSAESSVFPGYIYATCVNSAEGF